MAYFLKIFLQKGRFSVWSKTVEKFLKTVFGEDAFCPECLPESPIFCVRPLRCFSSANNAIFCPPNFKPGRVHQFSKKTFPTKMQFLVVYWIFFSSDKVAGGIQTATDPPLICTLKRFSRLLFWWIWQQNPHRHCTRCQIYNIPNNMHYLVPPPHQKKVTRLKRSFWLNLS